MEKINLLKAIRNLKKNFLLLFSTAAALCLFLSPSITSLAITGFIFIAVCIAASYDLTRPKKVQNRYAAVCAALIAVLIAFMGYDTFHTTWTSKVAALASALGTKTPILLTVVGLLGCVVGFYSMLVLGRWIVNIPYSLLKEKLPEQRKDVIIANLKRNWIFPISAMAFCCLGIDNSLGYCIGMIISFGIYLIIASQSEKLWIGLQKDCRVVTLFHCINSLGICWAYQQYFFEKTQQLISKFRLPAKIDIVFFAISIFGAIAAMPFVYTCIRLFWEKIRKILGNAKLFDDIGKTEYAIYTLLILVSIAVTLTAFAGSQAFYGTGLSFDIIYTSDSPSLVKGNVYMALTHPENDLKQPLFAVFAAPFMGIPYLIGQVFSVSAPVQAMLLNTVQILMLFAANFMLAKMMKLTRMNRICFMVLSSLTYTHLLFVLMMEQYIVAYFWLIFCIYLVCEKKQPNRIVLWGAGGTLLTSMILLPVMSEKSPFKNFKGWIGDMVKYGLEFIALMLVFGRFDVFYGLVGKISSLSRFTGKTVSFCDKLFQYTEFIKNCILAPNAGIDNTSFEHISWQLNQVTEICLIGILIFLLCLISAWMNRGKKSSQIAIGWVVFSVIMLLCLGWGTRENGLILYALYFGWAFLVLLFHFVEKIGERLNLRFLVPAATIVCAVMLAATNIPAIAEMVQFAIQYYPA